MSGELSATAREVVLRATRTMFPHEGLPDEAYAKVVRALEAEARGDESVVSTLEAGVAELDAGRALEELEGSEFFALLHATAVVELYDNPLVWKAFGYEGPSVHLGGYMNRGFDDLSWLPEPQITFAGDAPSDATPQTTDQFNQA